MTVAPSAHIWPGVVLGDGVVVQDFCVVGQPVDPRAASGRGVVLGARALVRSHTVIYEGVEVGEGFQTGHGVLIRQDTRAGRACSVGSGSVVEFGVRMGDGVRLHSRCFVPELSVLEDGCWLGPGVTLTNSRYPAGPRSKQSLEGVSVRRNARVGANATILPGLEIGEDALVGAGAVVTRDVPTGMVVVGNPARQVGRVDALRDAAGTIYQMLHREQ